MKNVQIDMMNQEIRMTKHFYRQSMEYGSSEFQMLSHIIREFPQFRLTVQVPKSHPNKVMFPSFVQMERWISLNRTDVGNEIRDFYRTIEMAHCSTNVYNYVRKWFFAKYGEEYRNSLEPACGVRECYVA